MFHFFIQKLYVKETKDGKGLGVFLGDLFRETGSILCEFKGDVISNTEGRRREVEYENRGVGSYMVFFQHHSSTKW